MTAGAGARRRLGRGCGVASIVLVLAACRLIAANPIDRITADDAAVASAAGWTRIASTSHYLVVVNVLPGEEMFTTAELGAQHPVVGESIVHGTGGRVGPDVRHVEAHIYDRMTGLPLDDLSPIIVLLNRTTGERTVIEPTLMQDVNIGALDVHYGNNVSVRGDSDLSLSVTIGDEEVTFDGHLD